MVAIRGFIYGESGVSGQLVCARQFMNSLEDSSLEECKRAIEEEPVLRDYYAIGEKFIKSYDGKVWFTFAGLDRSIQSVKSKGRILLLWADEAEPVTDAAWSIVLPTLREEGDDWNAELWVTWNPARKTAAVEKRFRGSNDPRIKVVECSWRDNPWFPAILERQRQRDMVEREDEYDHIWEGKYGSVQGAILGKWVGRAERQGRIHGAVEFDQAGLPIEITSDIGFRDTSSWWFWQRCRGGYRLLKYLGDSGLDADEWIPILQAALTDLAAPLGKIWLPHDARAKTFQTRETVVEKFVKAFGSKHIDVVPQTKKQDQISAARSVIAHCEFHETACEDGLDGLRAWEFAFNEDLQTFSKEPLHNWASHPSDAFAYGCQVMQFAPAPTEASKGPRFLHQMTANELFWPKQSASLQESDGFS